MDWFNIPQLKLDNNTRSELLTLADLNTHEFYDHYSADKGRYTNLQFLFRDRVNELAEKVTELFIEKPIKSAVLRVLPNKEVYWHVDHVKFQRKTVIIFPLSPSASEYAPCETINGHVPYMDCYAFSTMVRHRVVNNSYTRISFQLSFDYELDVFYKMYKNNQLFL